MLAVAVLGFSGCDGGPAEPDGDPTDNVLTGQFELRSVDGASLPYRRSSGRVTRGITLEFRSGGWCMYVQDGISAEGQANPSVFPPPQCTYTSEPSTGAGQSVVITFSGFGGPATRYGAGEFRNGVLTLTVAGETYVFRRPTAPTLPIVGEFALITVDGSPLPFSFNPGDSGHESVITAGSIQFRSDRSCEQVHTYTFRSASEGTTRTENVQVPCSYFLIPTGGERIVPQSGGDPIVLLWSEEANQIEDPGVLQGTDLTVFNGSRVYIYRRSQ